MTTYGIGQYGTGVYGSGEPLLGQTGYGSGAYGQGLYGYEAETIGGFDMFSRSIMDTGALTQVHYLAGSDMFSRSVMDDGAVGVHVTLQGSSMFSASHMDTGVLVENVALLSAGDMFSRAVMSDAGILIVFTGSTLAGASMVSRSFMDAGVLTQKHTVTGSGMFSRSVMDAGALVLVVPMVRIKRGSLHLFGPTAVPNEMPWKILWPTQRWPGTILVSQEGSVVYKEMPTSEEIRAAKYVLQGGHSTAIEEGGELHGILVGAGYEFEEAPR